MVQTSKCSTFSSTSLLFCKWNCLLSSAAPERVGPHIPQQPAIEHLIVLHGIPPGAPPDQYLQTDFCNILVIGVDLLAGGHILQAIVIQRVFIGQPDQAVIDHQLSVFQIVPALDDILQKLSQLCRLQFSKKSPRNRDSRCFSSAMELYPR